jgi:ferritin-like protein
MPHHPSVAAILRHFTADHLPPDLRAVSQPICDLAHALANQLPGDPETTVALRKLLEAKDCAVRAVIAGREV